MGCCNKKDDRYANADYGNPGYKGPETNDELKDGPIDKRSCTDLICCVIFIAYWGLMGYIGFTSLATGSPE